MLFAAQARADEDRRARAPWVPDVHPDAAAQSVPGVGWSASLGTGLRAVAAQFVFAAADAGRPAPRIISAVVACITDDADAARTRIATTSKPYATMPAFKEMLTREGVTSQVDLGLIGDEDTARGRAKAFIAAGATELIVREAPGTPEEAERTRAFLKRLLDD